MRKFANKSNLDPNKYQKNKNRAIRKALLARLVEQIKNNEFSNIKFKPQENSARKEYKSPVDRSSNNYGFMTSSEIGSDSPDVQ